ncbi:MAG: acyl-CoA synthetase [Rhodothalassiaceae bacterium]
MLVKTDPVMTPLSPIASLEDIRAVEATPLEARLPIRSTYDILADAAELHRNRTALRFLLTADPSETGVTLDYATLLDRITRFAHLLRAMGLTPRDTIAIVLPNLPQTHIALWGAEAEAVACMINPMLEPKQLEGLLRAAEARVLVCLGPAPGSDIWPKLESIVPRLSGLRAVFTVDPTHYVGGAKGWVARRLTKRVKLPKGLRHEDFDTALEGQTGGRISTTRRITETTPAAMFHTGGTTGAPKLAMHSHRNQGYMAWSLAGLAGLSETDTVLCGLPLFHVNGAMVTGLAPFSRGAEVVLAGAAGYRTPGLVENFWALVDTHKITSFSAVPTIYARLLQQPREGYDLSSLRFAICGAAPMSKELFKRFEDETGLMILEGYGLTEGTCASTTNPVLGARRIGSVGLRHPYQELAVASHITEEGRFEQAGPGEMGALLIRGPNVFLGYRQASANRGVLLADGWLNTGDLARIDGDGYVWLSGRAKDIIVRGGHNIDPAVIEETLANHPAVALCAAVGQPDPDAGELPCAYVTLRPGRTATAEELMAHARAEIPERAALPVHLEICEDLPLTAVGKISKPPLHQAAAERVVAALLESQHIRATFDLAAGPGGDLRLTVRAYSGADAARARDLLDRLAIEVSVSV